MSKQAVEQVFNGTFSTVLMASYDSTKVSCGSLIHQYSLSAAQADKFVGPAITTLFRPSEQSTVIPANQIDVVQWSSTQWWIFYADMAAATTTRRVGMYQYDPTTGIQSWRGFVTLTPPGATNHTVRGMRVLYQKYVTGTVTVSGTGVTGSGTTWLASHITIGSRIGFGSTDPTQISTWYEISAVGSDTSITLTGSATSAGPGAAYVIEDLMIVMATTASTATNGGLQVGKGLRYENFTSGGTTLAAAVSTDNLRATYWLADAATVTNTAAAGLAVGPFTSMTSQFVYVLNGAATSSICYKYNVRAALTVASGKATLSGADLVITGTFTTTGNQSQCNNGIIATTSHGPGSGVSCLYFVTTTRIYRAPLSGIVGASTTWAVDTMTENPPGTTATSAAFATMNGIDYDSTIDRFFVSTTGARSYVTQYRTDAGQMDHIFLADMKQLDQSTEDATAPSIPNTGTNVVYGSFSGGLLFLCRTGAAAGTAPAVNVNQIWTIPVGAHWAYTRAGTASKQMAVFPQITLGATATKLYRVFAHCVEQINPQGQTGDLGQGPEPFRLLYRTSGISDNSGAWTLVDNSGDLSGVAATTTIQFAAEWKTIGLMSLPGRLYSLCLTYEASDSLPAQYQWDYNDSDVSNGNFGFIQKTLWSITIPTHTINIYRADTDALVLTQASTGTTNGVFENWNGSSWVSGLGSDVVGTRRRFRPTGSLPGSVDLYAKITTS